HRPATTTCGLAPLGGITTTNMSIQTFLHRHKISLKSLVSRTKYRFGSRPWKQRILSAVNLSNLHLPVKNIKYRFAQLPQSPLALRVLTGLFVFGMATTMFHLQPVLAFPVVESVTPTVFGSDDTTHNVDMPSTVDAGDLLINLFASDGSATITDPDGAGGWTEIETAARSTFARGSVWAKVA